MSAGTQDGHAPPGSPHGEEAAHGSLAGYVTGFVLSVILTAIPFWLVMNHVLPTAVATTLAVMALAVAQIFVHMVFFLHMNTKSEGGWSMLALIFTLVVVTIALTGSVWVMFHLNANMTPMSAHDMRNAP
ncbi:cytochrome o ubiquinol oxidase subunit IV [Caulobacter sp. S45]|jgi:cytochrome o ubiquinol oxidase operon protein cyoD|uniref:cytochrome o ubiquinol oxidase subunit IV n=1 Tax=Caulobacter sp. S45 TaxID=1641861 RepID=UPI00131CBD77|nr:cytochrome o ubiquinol oxidase subunit IV [Caulobacter sp. S45]